MDTLIKRLREGLLSMGTSEDGEIDLYDIDDAYQVMDEAADALAEARRDLANECERRDDIIASETHLRKEAEAELAEARAQIAAKDAEIERLTIEVSYWHDQFAALAAPREVSRNGPQ